MVGFALAVAMPDAIPTAAASEAAPRLATTPAEARRVLDAMPGERSALAAQRRDGELGCRSRTLVNDCLARVRNEDRRAREALDARERAARALLREDAARSANLRQAADADARAAAESAQRQRRDRERQRHEERSADRIEALKRRADSEASRAAGAQAAEASRAAREVRLEGRRSDATARDAQAAANAARHEQRLRDAAQRNAERERRAAGKRARAQARCPAPGGQALSSADAATYDERSLQCRREVSR